MAWPQTLSLPLKGRLLTKADGQQASDLVRRPSVPVLVTVIAVVCALAGTLWSATTHSMLIYGDARAHLDTARRVTDGLRPGPTQLGSVWLPLPHILLVPVVAVTWLWHSGAGGALVGGACFCYSAVRVYSLVYELTGTRLAAWCSFGLFVANLNLLYLQSTALTEPVLLAFIIGAAFHLARWMRTGSVRSLAAAATMTLLATLSRYEGWAFLAAAAVLVLVWTTKSSPHPKQGEANTILFLSLGGYGIVLWVLYNLIIFHDPLYFLNSSFSAQSQQLGLAHAGLLGTKGHPFESVLTYGWAAVDVVGPVVLVLGSLAALTIVVTRRPGRRRQVGILALLAAPVLFDVVSLWLGQTTLRVPQRPPYGMFNDRYGVVVLPFLTVAAGCLAGLWRRLAPMIVTASVVGLALMVTSTPLTIEDGRRGASSAAGGHPELAAAYLQHHYRGGEVLVDSSRAEPLIFASGLDLTQFVTIGFQPWYDRALRSPATTVQWVALYSGDAIAADMAASPRRFADFHLVIADSNIRLYQRTG